jgi:DNA-binding HxlR family transcriptional regulator
MPGAADPFAGRLRAGGRALLLLADPISVSIIRQLAPGPLENTELLGRIGFVSRSTFFQRMRDLEDLSLLSRARRGSVPPVAECRLEEAAEGLLPVARRLNAWLMEAPQGPLRLGEAYATATVKALALAWGSTLLRWLAEKPRTLSALEPRVSILGYRKLERIVRDLVEVGLLERGELESRLPTYAVSEWGRGAASTLTAAMRWERQAIPEQSAPVASIEAEGVMLLGLPMVDLPGEASGTCALLVEGEVPQNASLGGAVVRMCEGHPEWWMAAGELRSDSVELEVDCWVKGSTLAWLGAHSSPSAGLLHVGGNTELAEMVLAALRRLGARQPSLPMLPDVEALDMD